MPHVRTHMIRTHTQGFSVASRKRTAGAARGTPPSDAPTCHSGVIMFAIIPEPPAPTTHAPQTHASHTLYIVLHVPVVESPQDEVISRGRATRCAIKAGRGGAGVASVCKRVRA